MTIGEMLVRQLIVVDKDDRIEMLIPANGDFELSRCNLGRFVYHDNIGRESAEQLIREAEAVFVRTEITQ